jgi:hypothetical protein
MIRPYFSYNYVKVGLLGVSTIRNGSLEIHDTSQTGPSFVDVTASINLYQGILTCSKTLVIVLTFFQIIIGI